MSPVVPYPPSRGSRVTTLSLIKTLSEDFEITVLARASAEGDLDQARELEAYCASVIVVLAPERKSFAHRLFYGALYSVKSMILRRSVKQLRDCSGPMVRAARELAVEDFDLVIISFWQLYKLMDLFSKDRTILLTHDIEWKTNRQISLLERNLRKKIQAVRRWLLEQPEELAAYRAASNVWALTEEDKSVVEAVCQNRCAVDVMPFGLDTEFYAASGMQRNRGEILLLGHLDEAFNLDALDFFVRKIYPHIDDLPEWSITIVGGNLPGDFQYFGLLPEVEVVGRVSDVRPYLHRASCLVVPLRFGGGLRVRVLEAMSAGLPVVSSMVGMNGLPFEPGKEFLTAKEPEEYASQIKRIFTEERLAASISAAASRRVRELFEFDSQKHRAIAMVRELIGQGRPTGDPSTRARP